MTIKMPAKINLYLRILNRREDGYHNLHTLMQSISLYDTITIDITLPPCAKGDVAAATEDFIQIECTDPNIPTDERNLAYKAAELFYEKAQIKNKGLKIHIDKQIPVEAGLGGGSADAAGVLLLLNTVNDNHFTAWELAEIGAEIGSDVPFFIYSGTVLCEGRGEIVTPMPPIGKCNVLIVKPDGGLSSKEIYRLYNENAGDACSQSNISDNDLEKAAVNLMPCIGEIKNRLTEYGALQAAMSGSGSAVFGIFKDESAADKAYKFFKEKYKNVYLTHTENKWRIM